MTTLIGLAAVFGRAETTIWDVTGYQSDPTFAYSNGTIHGIDTVDGMPMLNTTLNLWGSIGQNFPANRNWASYNGFRVTIENRENFPISIGLRVKLAGTTDNMLGIFDVTANKKMTFFVDNGGFASSGAYMLMPLPATSGYYRHTNVFTPRNLSAITGWQIYYRGNVAARVRIGTVGAQNINYSWPQCIDKFGQINYQVWDGKAYADTNLHSQRIAEDAQLTANPGTGETWGSHTLRATATGRWRTYKSPLGKWYLVTPQGKLFWSIGATSIRDQAPTVVQNQETLFRSLPATGQPGSEFFSTISSLRCFDFYCQNLSRKYGSTWASDWKTTAKRRMNSWGLNTLGSGSDLTFMETHNLPGVMTQTTYGFHKKLVTPSYFGSTIPDVFAGDFQYYIESTWRTPLMGFSQNGRLIGTFSDCEISWGRREGTTRQKYQIPIAALRAPKGQPAKIKFVNELRGRYAAVGNLNNAWGTSFPNWTYLYDNSVEILDEHMTPAAVQDFSKFLGTFAMNYYYKIKQALNAIGFTGLYLGSKESLQTSPDEVINMMVKYVDVASFNIYAEGQNVPWSWLSGLNKPILLSEFSFSAHGTGTPATLGWNPQVEKDLEGRGVATQDYLEMALASNAIVGAHWYTYIDHPASGRPGDRQNYPFGLVDICDRPHEDVTSVFRTFANGMYARRGL